jgi:hypothetical protein
MFEASTMVWFTFRVRLERIDEGGGLHGGGLLTFIQLKGAVY